MSILSTDLPPAFRRIDLELAREPAHPAGDPLQRYVVLAPLDGDNRLDAKAWREYRQACRVVRRMDGKTSVGHLVHGPGGQWTFHYDADGADRDELVFHLKDERLVPGEYISIVRGDGPHPFRVTTISTLQIV